MFVLILLIGSIFLYYGIVAILRDNAESNSIKQFQQNQYNLTTFASQVDLLSRQLAAENTFNELYQNQDISESGLIIQNIQALNQMVTAMNNSPYIDSIVYYGENGLAIKSSSEKNIAFYDMNDNTDRFYHTQAQSILRMGNMQLLWYGGFKNEDFGMQPLNATPTDPLVKNYITAVRIVSGQQIFGLLVININTDYFTSIFSHNNNSISENIYMINGDGVIISHRDPTEIGKRSVTYRQMSDNENSQSFTIGNGNQKIQAVYYRLGIADWVLVDETPLKVIEKNISYLQIILISMITVSLILAALLSRYWIYRLTKPLRTLMSAMKKMGDGNLGLTVEIRSKNELGILAARFNSMSANIQDLIHKNEEAAEEKRGMEMEALRAQINPHFVYNTLNAIRWMAILQKDDNVADSLETFANYLKPVFKNSENVCALREEMGYTLNYMKILNFRHMGAFTLHTDIPDGLLSCEIPRFVLQPLVENAIEHGFPGRESGEVTVSASDEAQTLKVRVMDNGNGINNKKLSEINDSLKNDGQTSDVNEKHIGLVNVHRRIRLQYGDPYGLTVCSRENSGAEIVLILPIIHKAI